MGGIFEGFVEDGGGGNVNGETLMEVNCGLTRLNARENLGLVFREAAGVALEGAGGEDEIYVDGNEDILRS